MRVLVLLLCGAMAFAAGKSDAEIAADLKGRLAKSKVGADGFQFQVKGGTVTWTGRTGIVQHKGAATRMAKSAGATKVDNRIEVSAAARERSAAQMKRTERPGKRTEQAHASPPPEAPPAHVPPPVRRATVKH